LVSGFKDKDGKFHPIGKSGVRKSRQSAKIRYANDSSLSSMLGQSVKDFAKFNRDKYNTFKTEQDKKFDEELVLRRKFRVSLIKSFRLARAQEITRPKELEKFIRQQIPDLPKGKATNRFVEKVLKEFIKEEKRFKNKLSGKSAEEKEMLETQFEHALDESESQFRVIQAKQDKKFRDDADRREKEYKDKITKLNKEAKDVEDANRQRDKDRADADRKEKAGAPKEEQERAEKKADASEHKAEQEEKQETTFAHDVEQELKKDTAEVKTEDFDFGFPSEIV